MEEFELKVFIKKMGVLIRELRIERKMTQLDLAISSNVDELQIQRLEASHTSPTIKTLYKGVKGLDVEVANIFDFPKNLEINEQIMTEIPLLNISFLSRFRQDISTVLLYELINYK